MLLHRMNKCLIFEVLCLVLLNSAVTFGDIVLIPNYDYNQTKIFDYKAINTLICNINSTQISDSDYVWQWWKDDVPIEKIPGNENKFEMKGNKLTIRRPLNDEDISKYSCVLFNKNTSSTDYVKKADFSTAGKPTAKLNTTVTVIEGEKLKLECIVTGKPTPTVEWRYENIKLERKPEGRLQIRDYSEKGIVSAFLEIEHAELSDRGKYSCSAHNIVMNAGFNSSEADTFVIVKEKLAALWPFIGICAEVIVLCAIIFVYERKRNKAELDESDTDQSPEQKNTPDHGKESVRQRK